jgi:tetratricopeptide (TPR) repeat protein
MNETMKVQTQIRQNAEEVSTFLQEMGKWEKSIKKKDSSINKTGVRPVRSSSIREGGTSQIKSTIPPKVSEPKEVASHTFDKSGKKWSDSELDAQLKKEDDEEFQERQRLKKIREEEREIAEEMKYMSELNPATLAKKHSKKTDNLDKPVVVSKARGVSSDKDGETLERQIGNEEFQKGNFQAAVKSYTKCLGMKVKNYTAFSNRAMAYLKLKDFRRAETDCDCALEIEPKHIKSLVRRATARNSLGKHRAALADLNYSLEIDPTRYALLLII